MADKVLTERPATSAAGRIEATRDFLTATQAEMRKVAWPGRPELVKATRMIIVLSIILGITIGLLDFGLQKILVDGVARMAR
jgi:preprotein translocase subunit SecE